MAKKATIVPVSLNDEMNKLASRVAQQYVYRVRHWKPAHDRMDYWFAMYELMDAIQKAKPSGYFRYISNDPKTAVDTAESILVKNDVFWDIDQLDDPDATEEVRARGSRIESALGGLVDDLSMLMLRRGEGTFWEQAAWFALLRGWVWGKFIVTEESGRDDEVPLQGEFWDPRQVLPLFDGGGLHSVIAAKQITMSQLISDYYDNENIQRMMEHADEYNIDLGAQAYKMEWWDFRRYQMTGVLATWPGDKSHHSFEISWGGSAKMPMNGVWVIEPEVHGYTSVNSPIVGVPVNGLPLKTRPEMPQRVQAELATRASLHNVRTASWEGPEGWISNLGRGILHAVEEHVPQFNEVMAIILQKFAQEAYDTLFVHTRSGELPELDIGFGAVNALRIEERVDRMQAAPASNDAWRILSILTQEKEKGTLANILSAASANFQGPGYLFQQIGNTALLALNPYKNGLMNFGTMFSQSMLHQLRDVNPGVLDLVHRSRADTFISISFDPMELEDRNYKVVPRFEPAVPDDMAIKAQTARLLLDPRNPVMSLEDVLQRIFRHPDAAGVQRRIWADVANREPMIVLMNIVQSLRAEGQDELADVMEQRLFQQSFIQDLQNRQLMAMMGMQGQLPGGEATSAGAGLGPEGGGTGAPGAAQEGMPPEGQGVDNAPSNAGAQA